MSKDTQIKRKKVIQCMDIRLWAPEKNDPDALIDINCYIALK